MCESEEHGHEVEPTGSAVSRRAVLGTSLVGGVAVGAAGVGAFDPASAAPDGRHTTLDQTLVKGDKGKHGYRKIVVGPGEPHLVRDELMKHAKKPGKARRRGVIAIGQLTDMHINDTQSPARVEFLDRLDDSDSPYAAVLPFQGAYRAQDMLSTHVADATVRALRKVGRGPVTGLPFAFTVTTGDNTDNTQYNELRWQIDLLDGEQIRPDSGDYTKYEGVADQNVASYNVRYWHPDGAPAGQPIDMRIANYGFPKVPGLLDTARKPFGAKGLGMPWVSVFGNHDGLVQGNVPSTPAVAAIATGTTKIIDLPPGANIGELAGQLTTNDPQGLATLFGGPSRQVTADPNRRPLARTETIAEYFKTAGAPHGHGYTAWNLATGNAYYAFGKGRVRHLMLDTVNPFGGSEGSIDETQLGWLTAELKKGSRHYLDETGHVVKGGKHDRLFVIYSHHTIDTMDNATGSGRVLGPAVRDLLLRFPNVVLWVNGHTHRNTVTPYARSKKAKAPGGFWEVNTAAHVDWPQQARTVEIVDNRNGTLSIFGTIIDHAAPTSWGKHPKSPLELAALSRELGANDWQERDKGEKGQDGRRGRLEDRNVELLVPAPFTPVAVSLASDLSYAFPRANWFQRTMKAFASTSPGAWFFSRVLRHLDDLFERVTGGRTTSAEVLAGLPVLDVTTTGRKSGAQRTSHLISIPVGEALTLIGTNFGQEHTPAWVFNLEAHPGATVRYRDRTADVVARPATPEEYEAAFAAAAPIYPGYPKYRKRIGTSRTLRVFVLEPALPTSA